MAGFPLIEVWPYQPSDLSAVIELFQHSIRETASADYNQAQIDAWVQVDRDEWELARASRPTWVALVDGDIAGFADLEKNGLIDMMFVHPKYQRQSVGTSLLARIEAEADECGITCLHTYSSITAKPFFEYCGFTMLLARAVVVRDERFIQYVMEKVL
ncbi:MULTISPECIES: GNAT family N-acetyltransferase [unclassified Caballeronia]|uniref:GNAT family N-acetyltransferase n=1 Tax=unclassified Caballeronia TaxID=2646786 RepID=UPI00285927B9|nr:MULTISPECIES: GNAT family N-acetyltransferase [unclassified Caballeronia]MDR5817646.1 GNAT family N-acetyltransferase [Caballeronia sp. LZ033]MDR5824588.1 GNAT family N-acetyltransferase [Caballeronia sp. LZ043]MDR5882481.1 GNAT family N-acetyltransferase [Caballeronia sp. LZ032]